MDDILLGREQLLERTVRHLQRDGGVVLAGLPWVGRTRLLREALAGVPVEHVMCRATVSGRDTPFGNLGPLAPRDPSAPATWMEEFTANLPDPDAIVAVDGAQFLDDHSALLLLHAVEAGAVRLALSVWRSHPAPDAVLSIWTDGLLPRVDVDPLDRETSDAIVRRFLGGPVEEATLLELWETCRGYPLLLREYLEGSRAAGALVERDGLWVSVDRLVHSRTLVDTARQVRVGLAPEALEALDLLAVAEPLAPATADRLVTTDVLDELERWDLFVLDDEGRYRLPAPGWAEALRDGLSSAERRRLARRLVSALPPLPELEGAELVRAVRWHREGGTTVEGDQLLRAALAAQDVSDPEEVASLARSALGADPLVARLVLADARARTGDVDGAVALLGEVAELTDDHTEAAHAVVTAARLQFLRAGRTEAGVSLLRNGLTRTDHPEARALVQAELGLFYGLLGDLEASLEVAGPVAVDGDQDPRIRFAACRNATVAAMWTGRLTDARRYLAAGTVAAARLGPAAATTLEFCSPVIELNSGRPRVALGTCEQGYRRALERGHGGAAAVWAVQAATCHLLAGDLDQAVLRATEGVQLAERDDEYFMLPLGCGIRALVAAYAGDGPAARRWLTRLGDAGPNVAARVRVARDEAMAFVRALDGDVEGAARSALTAAEEAARRQQFLWAAKLAYETVRFGYGELALDLLERVAPRVEGEAVPLQLAHAAAVVDGDGGALERVADRLLVLGFAVWGAEAHVHAAELHARAGRPGPASRVRARATALTEQLAGIRTPALRAVGGEPLTRREREVAVLAADGRTSPEIAEQLVVSVRTVDNHLASVYRKLGISGRQELAYVMTGT